MSHAHKRQAHTRASTTNISTAPISPTTDIYQRITDQIIKAIEAGAGDWKMPWHTTKGEEVIRPVNAITDKPYRGVNVLSLWISGEEKGYTSNRWATYRQWSESGAQVRKGEKSTLIVFWKVTGDSQESEEQDPGESKDEEKNRLILARGYPVFNTDQVDGYKSPALPVMEPTVSPFERITAAETFFAALGADIRHGGNRAYYRPTTDHIQMPPFAAFQDAITYYSTTGHEVIHWTGAKHRLDRNLSKRFGDEAYAAEELIAELGAAYLCADLGLANVPRPDHAAYVASWLKVLKNDPKAIFTAAARAQAAIDYVHGLRHSPEPNTTQIFQNQVISL